ncbi:sensor histidine kinase [Azospirillum picis]|uniref:histidine kinase n=1 Tax=Azospirillum picis TaxID=488438 RepID=A0ABU0MDB6_9PROT|nr:sensor histidine kinase [Azospirillum picis]MBP2297545.1 two-component sensor histidine kinase [Azospirillum picis]MDQ0531432.1 two-component sensor histidine kinase [Azospirillum picis]
MPRSPGLRRRIRRLGLGTALSAAVVTLALGLTSYDSYRWSRDELRLDLETQADSLADRGALTIQAASLLLDRAMRLGEDTDWTAGDAGTQVAAELRRLRDLLPTVVRIGLWDTAGRPLATTESDFPAGLTVADRPYFGAIAQADGHMVFSTPLASMADGMKVLVLGRRLTNRDGAFAGAATITVRPAEIAADLMRGMPGLRMGEINGVRWLRRADADPGPERTGETEIATLSRAAPTPDGIAVRRPVGNYPLLVEVTASRQAALERWVAGAAPVLALELLVLVLLGTVALLLLRWSAAEAADRNSLAALAGRLRRANAELEENVSDRTRALTEALAQRDLLLREVNHRLKNSLQLAASLVQMQRQVVQSPDTRQQLTDTVARLHAIARVHDQLYQSTDVRSVEMSAYLAALSADLEQSAPADEGTWRLRVIAEPIELPTDQAVPLGLMVNELVTNAMKHARPASADPTLWTIEIGLARAEDGQIALTVRDHGPGLPAGAMTGRPRSLGMRLLTGLTRQLDAGLTVEAADPGARVVIRFRPQPAQARMPATV